MRKRKIATDILILKPWSLHSLSLSHSLARSLARSLILLLSLSYTYCARKAINISTAIVQITLCIITKLFHSLLFGIISEPVSKQICAVLDILSLVCLVWLFVVHASLGSFVFNSVWLDAVTIKYVCTLEDFGHNLASVGNECNCTVVGAFFGTAFLWDWDVD